MTMLRYLLCGILLLAQGLLAEEAFKTYTNDRFGYTIEYPARLLIPQGGSEKGDSQLFVSADGQARLITYISNNSQRQSIKDIFQKESRDASSAKITKKVTYKIQKDNWFVVSGYIGSKIFYQKTFLTKELFKTFYIEYPQNQRHIYDPIMSRLGRSFRG